MCSQIESGKKLFKKIDPKILKLITDLSHEHCTCPVLIYVASISFLNSKNIFFSQFDQLKFTFQSLNELRFIMDK